MSVGAEAVHYEPAKPLNAPTRPADLLRIDDVLGTRHIDARLMGRLKIREENAAGALEVMSRFAMAPQWLPYLPPTMAPCATSTVDARERRREFSRGPGVGCRRAWWPRSLRS